MKNQRAPKGYVEIKKPIIEQIDNVSPYVEENLKRTVKPRNKEYR